MRRALAQPRPADVAVGREPEPASVEALYRRHAGWLSGRLSRRFTRAAPSLVEDVVQETYLRTTRAGAQLDVQNPRAFLSRIAHRLMLDEIRSRSRRDRALSDPVAQPPTVSAPEQDEALLLKQALLSLPPPLRDVLLLSRVVGLDYAAIAQECGISVKTVEWRISKALDQCRQLLADAPAQGPRASKNISRRP